MVNGQVAGKYASLDHELHSVGSLSLSKAVKWLKKVHPEASVSYPTALKLVETNKLRSRRVGNIHRIDLEELNRFVAHGNWNDSEELISSSQGNANESNVVSLTQFRNGDDHGTN